MKSKNEPIWESGAKNFILTITLAMLEDSEKPELGTSIPEFFNGPIFAGFDNLNIDD